jgi:hypothetical protein
MTANNLREAVLRDPTDFGEGDYATALVNVTNVCNLSCSHCFVFRDDNPSNARDKMDDATMLRQLEILRDRHNIKSMLFMGGEPMIRKDLVMQAASLGHLILIMAFRAAPASTLQPFHYVVLIWATMVGYLAFDDLPDIWTILGALVIAGSGIYAFYREQRAKPAPVEPAG